MDYEATDAHAYRMAKAAELRDLLADCGLSQRAAARALEISDRQMRYYCAGTTNIPRGVWLALDAIKANKLAL